MWKLHIFYPASIGLKGTVLRAEETLSLIPQGWILNSKLGGLTFFQIIFL